MIGPRDRSFEEEVFIQLFHRMQQHFDVSVRHFHGVHVLGGSGNVWCNETQSKYFQVEIAYPFDPAELKRDNTKLCAHVALEAWRAFLEQLAPHGLKPDQRHRLFFLATPELKPAWLEEHLHGELKGAYQLSLRLTLAAPDHLPFGLDGPKLIVPTTAEQRNADTDIHAAREEAERETRRLLNQQKEELEALTRIDLDASRRPTEVSEHETLDGSGSPVVLSSSKEEGEPVE